MSLRPRYSDRDVRRDIFSQRIRVSEEDFCRVQDFYAFTGTFPAYLCVSYPRSSLPCFVLLCPHSYGLASRKRDPRRQYIKRKHPGSCYHHKTGNPNHRRF